MAIKYEYEALKLLEGTDKECEELFTHLMSIKNNIPISMVREVIGRVKFGRWKYVYTFNTHKVEYSMEPIMFQDGILENNNIICFSYDNKEK